MIQLLMQGQWGLFAIIMFALVLSLTVHEYGHAIVAYWNGDDTAKRQGRLTLNPLPHIDPFGLIMIIFIGFGFAKPVPVDFARLKNPWATAWVAAAGPLMNLLLAFLMINLYFWGYNQGWPFFQTDSAQYFFLYLAMINLILMLFNLIPIGPLDGHYILPYLLPKKISMQYQYYNALYGNYLFIALIALSLMGVPVFQTVLDIGRNLLPYIVVL